MTRSESRTSFDPQRSRVCVLTDETLSGGRSHLEVARLALAGGADHIQLRDKHLGACRLYELGLALRELTLAHGRLLFVNDRPDIAAAVGADGVHLGQDDLPVASTREVFGSRLLIGASARSLQEALDAEAAGADYLGVGPIYEARASKPDAVEPQGLDLIRTISARCRIPIIAIGGITTANAPDVMRAGASGVAVISAVVAAEDIAGATATLRDVVCMAVPGPLDPDHA